MEDRIKAVVSAVLNISIDDINNDSSPDTIESWDSLKHMNLIVALEEEFEIIFDEEDFEVMLNFQLISLTIREKI
jgi:acyl carrier protein